VPAAVDAFGLPSLWRRLASCWGVGVNRAVIGGQERDSIAFTYMTSPNVQSPLTNTIFDLLRIAAVPM